MSSPPPTDATMSSPQASIVQTLGDKTIPEEERAVPHEDVPHKPAPKPYPVNPSSGPLLTKYRTLTEPPPVPAPELLPDPTIV